jgi:hypothetical protein
MNRGVLRVSFELLHDLLGLDADHRVYRVSMSDKDFGTDVFSIAIEGPKCPRFYEGDVLPLITLDDIAEPNRRPADGLFYG